MALSGKIADWSLADILQMVAAERKTGVLTLHREGEEARFEFREGGVVNAHDRKLSHKGSEGRGEAGRGGRGPEPAPEPEGLIAYLKVTGRIQSEDVSLVSRLIGEAGGDPSEALRRAQILSPEALGEAFSEYAQELLHRVLTWQAGDYHFVARPVFGPAPSVVLSTEGLLLEGMRRIDETPRILEVVHPETVFRRRPTIAQPEEMPAREVSMLALVDGVCPAGKLARVAQLSDYDAAKNLYRLVELGLIEPIPVEIEEPVVVDLSLEDLEPAPRRSRILRMLSLLLLCAVSLAFRELSHRPGAVPTTAASQDQRLVEGVHLARAVYRDTYGREAQSADDLRRAGLLPSAYWGRAAQAIFTRELEEQKAAAPPATP